MLVSSLGMVHAQPLKHLPVKLACIGWQQRTMSHASNVYSPVAVQKYLKACSDLDRHILWAEANWYTLQNQLRLGAMEIATAKKIRAALSVGNFTGK